MGEETENVKYVGNEEEKEGNQTAKVVVLKGPTWITLNLVLVVNIKFGSYLMGLDFSPNITLLFPLLGLNFGPPKICPWIHS